MMSMALQALFTNTLYFISLKNLSQFEFQKLHFFSAIAISTIISLCLSPTLGGIGNSTIICFGIFLLFLKTKELLVILCYSLSSMLIMFVANAVGTLAFYIVFENAAFTRENPLHICLLYSITAIVAFSISKLLGMIIRKKLNDLLMQLSRKYFIFLLLGVLAVFLFFYYQLFVVEGSISDPIANSAIVAVFTIAYLVFMLVAVYMFVRGVKKSIEAAHKQELLIELQNYITNLENMYTDMRRFRHDYMNIIAVLYGYIQAKDMEGIENFFINNISPMVKKINRTNSTLDRLKNIRILEIKGLLTLKLMHAQELGASLHIEVQEEVHSVNFDILDLTRVIGILIDNAMEACLKTEAKVLKFALIDKKNVKIMIIANSFPEPLPPISEMFKDGFSTKGDQHGLGLYTVRQIIDHTNTAILNTYIENGSFIQELRIQDTLTDVSV